MLLRWNADLSARLREAEVMDQPGLDRTSHLRALKGLARLNWISRSAAIVWKPLAALMPDGRRPLRVLDLATGSGDVLVRVWQCARRRGRSVDLWGVDASPLAIETARERAARTRAAVRFEQLDVLKEDLPSGFDAIICSLFLHHLESGEAIGLLARMAGATRRLVLANDLVRSRIGLRTVTLATRLVTRSEVVHVDAVRSVRAAFTVGEARELARAAGMQDARVTPRWPCRMLLTWERR